MNDFIRSVLRRRKYTDAVSRRGERVKKKVAIIGSFEEGSISVGGQTIKTRILYDELKSRSDWEIRKVDTSWKEKQPIKLLLRTFGTLLTHRHVIVLLSVNGIKFYFPILYAFAVLGKLNVYHDVIGGRLDKLMKANRRLEKYLNSFAVNWVETEGLKQRCEALGLKNAIVLPNFKRLNIAERSAYSPRAEEPFRFCIFSRVLKEKGIEDAIEAVESINRTAGRERCKLDIYGAIDKDYAARFDEVMAGATSSVSYCGIVPYDQSAETLSQYFALLFPTYWDGEGFPGTIVDAYSAGLPVIATDWNCNAELVEPMKTGILYPNEHEKDLVDAINRAMDESEQFRIMRKSCLDTARNYMPDPYIRQIIHTVEHGLNA